MKIKSPPTTGVTPEVVQWMREVMAQVNALSEGRMAAFYVGGASAPTSGNFAAGDFWPNTNKTELGAAGSKYVIQGWDYIGGVWLQRRTLTGN